MKERRDTERLKVKPSDNVRNDEAEIEVDRIKLLKVMTCCSSKAHDPVELSNHYIQRCITDSQLGKGAFGVVFLAEDCHRPKKFAIEKVVLDSCNEGITNEIRNSFQRELSVRSAF